MIARQGRLAVLTSLAVSVVAAATGGLELAVPIVLFTLFLLYILRDPNRQVPSAPLAVVSPVDGQVTTIEDYHDRYLDRPVKRITLRINILGTYGIRSPIEGKFLKQWIYQDNDRPQQTDGSQRPPAIYTGRHFVMVLQTDENDTVVMIVRLIPMQRPRCYIHVGERIGQGQRCGWLMFGGVVDLMLPESSRLSVAVGDRVKAGSDIIASLVH